jgi:hypothetical protein
MKYVIKSSLIAADESIAKLQFSNSCSSWPMFLCSVKTDRFFIPATFRIAMRAVAVRHGRRPPAKPARSVLDGREHVAMFGLVGQRLPYTSSDPEDAVCRGHGSLRGRCKIASSWAQKGIDAAM